MDLKKHIRNIPDFPKPGILFRDITPLLLNPEALQYTINQMAALLQNKKIDVIIAAEARGFIFGGALAYKLGCSFAPVRKPNKLPYKTEKAVYTLEYGKDSLEIHTDSITPGEKVLVLDDLLATGGTTKALIDLGKKLGGDVIGAMFLIELEPLKGRELLGNLPVYSIIKY
jgi:adenine phosphoribosyltransferase